MARSSPQRLLKPTLCNDALLPRFFETIADTRDARGKRYPLPVVLTLATAAAACGYTNYKEVAGWARRQSQTYHYDTVDQLE